MASKPEVLQALLTMVADLLDVPGLDPEFRHTVKAGQVALYMAKNDRRVEGHQNDLAELFLCLLPATRSGGTASLLETVLANEKACAALRTAPLHFLLGSMPCVSALMTEIGDVLAEQLCATPPGALFRRLPPGPLRDALFQLFMCARDLHIASDALGVWDACHDHTFKHGTDALVATKKLTDALKRLAGDKIPVHRLPVALSNEFLVFRRMFAQIFDMYIPRGTYAAHHWMKQHRKELVLQTPLKTIIQQMTDMYHSEVKAGKRRAASSSAS